MVFVTKYVSCQKFQKKRGKGGGAGKEETKNRKVKLNGDTDSIWRLNLGFWKAEKNGAL